MPTDDELLLLSGFFQVPVGFLAALLLLLLLDGVFSVASISRLLSDISLHLISVRRAEVARDVRIVYMRGEQYCCSACHSSDRSTLLMLSAQISPDLLRRMVYFYRLCYRLSVRRC
jgi:hypothetical protein